MLTRLLPSEIFLILLVISLWLISIFICLRRYSLFLCFHKRDVPYYNKELLNDPKKTSETGSNRYLSPNQSIVHNNSLHNSSNENNNLIKEKSNDNDVSLNSTYNSNIANTVINELDKTYNNNSIVDQTNQVLKQENQQMSNSNRKKHFNKRQFSYAGTQRDPYKSSSSNNFNNSKLFELNKSMQTSKSCSSSKPKDHLFSKNVCNEDEKSGYYFGTGVHFQTSSTYASSLLNKTYSQKRHNKLNKFKPNSPLTNNSSNNSSNIILDSQNDYNTLSINNKRAVIKKKHFNLMSLDENALNMYRKDGPRDSNQFENKNSNLEVLDENTDITYSKPKEFNIREARKKLATPHANFISLRSGSDSVANSLAIQNYSVDEENCDSTELFSSASLNKSLSMLRPSSIYSSTQKQTQRSISPINNTSEVNELKNKDIVLTTSQRPINPISSLRRHMFVNSRRNAQTTVDQPKYFEDSINFEQSYDPNSVSINSSHQLSSTSNNQVNNLENPNQKVIASFEPSVSISINEPTIEEANEVDDPNLLNPEWIPRIVKRTLLEIHERAVLSKSDSNIKSKHRSSNHLLHSPSSKQTSKIHKSIRKKKPLSLQNSHDKTVFNSVSSTMSNKHSSSSQNNNGSYLNNFYDDLRTRFFQSSNSSKDKSSSSTPNTATASSSIPHQPNSLPIDNNELINSGKKIVGSNLSNSGSNSPNVTNLTITTTISNDTVEKNNSSNFSSDFNLINVSNNSINLKK